MPGGKQRMRQGKDALMTSRGTTRWHNVGTKTDLPFICPALAKWVSHSSLCLAGLASFNPPTSVLWLDDSKHHESRGSSLFLWTNERGSDWKTKKHTRPHDAEHSLFLFVLKTHLLYVPYSTYKLRHVTASMLFYEYKQLCLLHVFFRRAQELHPSRDKFCAKLLHSYVHRLLISTAKELYVLRHAATISIFRLLIRPST